MIELDRKPHIVRRRIVECSADRVIFWVTTITPNHFDEDTRPFPPIFLMGHTSLVSTPSMTLEPGRPTPRGQELSGKAST